MIVEIDQDILERLRPLEWTRDLNGLILCTAAAPVSISVHEVRHSAATCACIHILRERGLAFTSRWVECQSPLCNLKTNPEILKTDSKRRRGMKEKQG